MRIAKFTQTPFISYDDKNMVYISVEDWDMCNPYEIQIFLDEQLVCEERVFAPTSSLLVPCCEQKSVCRVVVKPFEDLPVESAFTVIPPKHWQIPIMYSSHEDLGYCAYIDKLHYECYKYLKKAMDLCDTHDDFRYVIEHFWWLDAFDCYATEQEKECLRHLFKTRRIELNAIHSGVHTSWENAEQLVRGLYFGCRDAKKRYDADATCAMYADLSGVTWSSVNAYYNMGIRYMAAFANGFRNSKEKSDTPPLFWWESQSGEERVLFWYQRAYRPHGLSEIWCDTKRQYAEGEYTFDSTKAQRTERWLTERIEQLGAVNYDILPLCFYDDRELPTTMLLTVCDEMNKRWKYPAFRMEIPSVFLQDIEKKYGDLLPIYRGDIADQWADFITISPQLTADRRELSRRFYEAEMLSVIQGVSQGVPYESNIFDHAVRSMCEFDEHCWATSSKHPQKMHRYNIEQVKVLPVQKSLSDINTLLNRMLPEPVSDAMTVFNTIPHQRNSSLRLAYGMPVPDCVNHQILPDNSVITTPLLFDATENKHFTAVPSVSTSVEIEQEVFKTDFYTVHCNLKLQKIVSIIDRETGEELLDQHAAFELGQFIYLYTEEKTKPISHTEIPKKLDFRVYEGDVAYVITQNSHEEQSGAEITAQFIFYKYEKNIDIDLSYKNALGFIGDFYDRYKKNYFFSFPFKLDEPEFYTELPIGEINEKTDRIPINAADFSVTQNWVSAENSQRGIALFTRDMPAFHIGKIKYNHFDCTFDEDKAHFYLYAGSNRCNNLIYTSPEQCRAHYRLSILPYSGKHNVIVPIWSNEKEHELLIGCAQEENKQYIRIDKSNIRLVALKKAADRNDAIIIRLTETAGQMTDGEITLFLTPTKAMYTTNDENDIQAAQTNENRVRFSIQPYSCISLKVYGDFIL